MDITTKFSSCCERNTIGLIGFCAAGGEELYMVQANLLICYLLDDIMYFYLFGCQMVLYQQIPLGSAGVLLIHVSLDDLVR